MTKFVVDIEWAIDGATRSMLFGPFAAQPTDETVARLVEHTRREADEWAENLGSEELPFLYGCDVRTREEFDRRGYPAEKILPPPLF